MGILKRISNYDKCNGVSLKLPLEVLRRARHLQQLGLDLPSALAVVSAALALWRKVAHKVFPVILPFSDELRDSLVTDALLTIGIALSPLGGEEVKAALRAEHGSNMTTLDKLVARFMTRSASA